MQIAENFGVALESEQCMDVVDDASCMFARVFLKPPLLCM
jgi:hypothetical protein